MKTRIIVKWGREILGEVETDLTGEALQKAFKAKAHECACGSIDPLLEDWHFSRPTKRKSITLDINNYS